MEDIVYNHFEEVDEIIEDNYDAWYNKIHLIHKIHFIRKITNGWFGYYNKCIIVLLHFFPTDWTIRFASIIIAATVTAIGSIKYVHHSDKTSRR